MSAVPPDAAVVLAGGGGRRLGGVDKATLSTGGRTLLERALAATEGIDEVLLVGPDRGPTGDPRVPRVRRVREDPPGGGPAAGLLAGLATLTPAVGTVLVLAVDMPAVTPATVARLGAALGGHDGALLHDVRRQPLCGVYRRARLLAAAPPDPHGLPVHRLLAGLDLVEVPALPGEAHDVDTWADLD